MAVIKMKQLVAENSNLVDDMTGGARDNKTSLMDMIEFTKILTRRRRESLESVKVKSDVRTPRSRDPECTCFCHRYSKKDGDRAEEQTQTSFATQPIPMKEENEIENRESLANIVQEILYESKVCRCFERLVERESIRSQNISKVSCHTLKEREEKAESTTITSAALTQPSLTESIIRSEVEVELPIEELSVEESAKSLIEEIELSIEESIQSVKAPSIFTSAALTQRWLDELIRLTKSEVETPPTYTSAALAQRWLDELIRRFTIQDASESDETQRTSTNLAQTWLDELVRRSNGEIETLPELTSPQVAQNWLDECIRCSEEIESKFTSAALAQMLLNEIEAARCASDASRPSQEENEVDAEKDVIECIESKEELITPPSIKSLVLAQEFLHGIQQCADECNCLCHSNDKAQPEISVERSESSMTVVAVDDACKHECRHHCPKEEHDSVLKSETTRSTMVDIDLINLQKPESMPVQVVEAKRKSSLMRKLSTISHCFKSE